MPSQKSKLSIKFIAEFLHIQRITVSRIAAKPKRKVASSTYDPTFPKFEYVGRSPFVDGDLFFKWLSAKAGGENNTHG